MTALKWIGNFILIVLEIRFKFIRRAASLKKNTVETNVAFISLQIYLFVIY